MTGQINLTTLFGQALAKLGAHPELKTFIEIGTWNGEGSTACIAEGIKDRKDISGVRFFSLETNRELFEEATEFWKDAPYVKIFHGRVTDKLMPLADIMNHPYFPSVFDHFIQNYEQDIYDFYSAPQIHMKKADMILLDGGEFSTYQDWLALKDLNPRVVALDDTLVMKSERILRELKEAGWIVLLESEERQGCAILTDPANPVTAAF